MSNPHELAGYSLAYNIDTVGSYGVKIFIRRPLKIQELVDTLSPDDRGSSERFFSRAAEAIYAGLEAQAASVDPETARRRSRTKNQFREVFEKSGFGPVFLQEIPNEYGRARPNGEWSALDIQDPWYLVPTFLGQIKIGWRRSVISIEWGTSILKGLDARTFITFGEGTRWETGIHAYSYEEAIRYLLAVRQQAQILLDRESLPL